MLTALFFVAILLMAIGCLYFIRLDWKRYGLLYLIAAISANLLCYVFTVTDYYSFPRNVLHKELVIPYALVSSAFPFAVLFGVRYSPEKWVWKIPFYWGLIHIGVLFEVILLATPIFTFQAEWDLWDSYSLRWVYYLLFEILGGKLIPPELRSPISSEAFKYGRWAWIVFHVIVISTIFLAGVYVGITLF
ncbi:CBO0543 family protein [Peribacillus sp. SCS-155]|uniref:CBO0543 family protein n=1 Tax=Peribacillus sedimenti TaxID=3115297 RepID=UPI003906A38D